MSNYCNPDDGFDYVFGRLSAIYGAAFVRHWDGIDPDMIRQEWKHHLGVYLTYRPKMDYAINCCDPDFPPSALKFKDLCVNGPSIPGPVAIEHKRETKPMPDHIRERLKEWRIRHV